MEQEARRARVHATGRPSFGARSFGALQVALVWLNRETSILNPLCFALVMATGIVSNAFLLNGYVRFSDSLFALALAAYIWLWLLTAWRAVRYGGRLWNDLVSPNLVFSFFTIVAATDVVGVAIAVRGFEGAALPIWLFALSMWLILAYLGFAVFALRNTATGANVIQGAWLNAIVGTQSLVILGTLVIGAFAGAGSAAYFLIYALWMVGLALYGILAVLLSYRIFFFELKTDDATPVLWVVMGAAAISANAGSELVAGNGGMPFLEFIRPLVGGLTLAMWAWATWLIPLLILLGLWKHGVRRMPLTYTPMLWCVVFPLGMYSVASLRLSTVAHIPALAALSWAMTWIAFAAWIATGIGLITSSWRGVRAFKR
jgi:tellurite resistance protein TehA-like permease